MKNSALMRSMFCVAALSYSFLAHSAPAQLLVNGGFETGNLTGWTLSDPSDFSDIDGDSAFAYGGSQYYVYLGAFGLLGSLSQTFTTVPGQAYNLTFALANDGAAPPPNEFDVLWDGSQVSSLANVGTFGYTIFSVNNLIATNASTTLGFLFRNDADFFRIDDVAVNAVPEMSATAFILLGAGFFGFICYRRNRGNRSVSA